MNIKYLFIIYFIFSLSITFAQNNEIVSTDFTGYISADNIRVRESYTQNSKILGFLKIGTKVHCVEMTKIKYTIDDKLDYWYKCVHPEFGLIGWVYGAFISKNKFDENKYLNSLPSATIKSDLFSKLLNSTWVDCKPGSNMGCIYVKFSNTSIETGSDIWGKTYLIQSLSDLNKNNIVLQGKFILSWSGIVNDPNEVIKYTITLIDDGTIKINNKFYYKK